MLDTPVVLIVFNRPDLTLQTLERILEMEPSRLFVIGDGPRPGHPHDEARCAEVRGVIAAHDPSGAFVTHYSDTNLGCEAAIELGLDWVFEQVDRAIIFEDDCVADPSFFRYCTELLERYEDEPVVMQISGSSLLAPREAFGGASYAFSAFGATWGWATWRRAWSLHRARFPRGRGQGAAADVERARVPEPPRPRRKALTGGGRRYFSDVARSEAAAHQDGIVGDAAPVSMFGWDASWWLTIMQSGGLVATPAYNLVENLGFRDDATHTRSSRTMPRAESMPFPLVHPPDLAADRAIQQGLEVLLVRSAGRLARTGRRFIRGSLRGVARRVVGR